MERCPASHWTDQTTSNATREHRRRHLKGTHRISRDTAAFCDAAPDIRPATTYGPSVDKL